MHGVPSPAFANSLRYVEWFDELSQNEWERTLVVIDRLASLGSKARMPFSRSLGDGLFEVRFTLAVTARRITHRFTKDGRIILLTTFGQQRTNERAEVTRARRSAQACAKRNPWKETSMSNYSRWEVIKKTKGKPSDEHLVLSFPVDVPDNLTDAVQVA